MANSTLLDYLADHLAARGVTRKPGVAGAAHPLWIEPALGTPAPDEKQGVAADAAAVLGVVRDGSIAVGAYESWYEKPTVQFFYRVRKAYDVDAIHAAVAGEFEDRRAWTTATTDASAGLYVIESGVWRPMQRLGSSKEAYTFTATFWFQVYSGRAPRG